MTVSVTLVIDASAVAEILLGTARGVAAATLLGDHQLIAPQHLTAEIASVIRGWSLGGYLTERLAMTAFSEFEILGIERITMMPLLPAVYALRHNFTAYDAMYVALARAVGCKFRTLDLGLAKSAVDYAVVP